MKVTERELRSAIRKQIYRSTINTRNRKLERESHRGRLLIKEIAQQSTVDIQRRYELIERRHLIQEGSLPEMFVNGMAKLLGWMYRIAGATANKGKIGSVIRFLYGSPSSRASSDPVEGIVLGLYRGFSDGGWRGSFARAGQNIRTASNRHWFTNAIENGTVRRFGDSSNPVSLVRHPHVVADAAASEAGQGVRRAATDLIDSSGRPISPQNLGVVVDDNGRYVTREIDIEFSPPDGGPRQKRTVEVYEIADITQETAGRRVEPLYLPADDMAQTPRSWRTWGRPLIDSATSRDEAARAANVDVNMDLIFVRTRAISRSVDAGASPAVLTLSYTKITTDFIFVQLLLDMCDVPFFEDVNITQFWKSIMGSPPLKLQAALESNLALSIPRWNEEMDGIFGGREDISELISLGPGDRGPTRSAFLTALEAAATPHWFAGARAWLGNVDSTEITETDFAQWQRSGGEDEITILKNMFNMADSISYLSSLWLGGDTPTSTLRNIRQEFLKAWDETDSDIMVFWNRLLTGGLQLDRWGAKGDNLREFLTSRNSEAFQELVRIIEAKPIMFAYVGGKKIAIHDVGDDALDPSNADGTLFKEMMGYMGNFNDPDTFLGSLNTIYGITTMPLDCTIPDFAATAACSGSDLSDEQAEEQILILTDPGTIQPGEAPIATTGEDLADVIPELDFEARFSGDVFDQALGAAGCAIPTRGRAGAMRGIESLKDTYLSWLEKDVTRERLDQQFIGVQVEVPSNDDYPGGRQIDLNAQSFIRVIRIVLENQSFRSVSEGSDESKWRARLERRVLQRGFNQLSDCQGVSLGNGNPWWSIARIITKYSDCPGSCYNRAPTGTSPTQGQSDSITGEDLSNP